MSNKKYVLFIIFIVFTLLVIVCGVLFSVRDFASNCSNTQAQEVDEQIQILLKQECENQSIFLINESKIQTKIESEIPQVNVINIERIFPNKIKVNYSYKKAYAYLVDDGKYKYFTIDGNVVCVDGGERAKTENWIKVLSQEELGVGENIFFQNSEEGEKFHILLDMIEKMGINNANDLISEIDFNSLSSHLLIIKLREGATIEICYPTQSFSSKVRLLFSALLVCEKDKREKGVWRVYSDRISYAKN